MTALVNANADALLDAAVTTGYKVRLMTANGTAATAGTEVVNAGGSTYAAQSSTWGLATFSSTTQTKTTTADITFSGMPVCTVVGVEVWDSANTTRKAFGSCPSKTFALNDVATISAGNLTLSFT